MALHTLEDVLRRTHTYVTQLTFRNADLSLLHEVDGRLLDGSVSSDRKRDVRWTAQVSLENSSGLFTPSSPSSLVWPGRPVRIQRGAIVGSSPQYVTLMTGLIESIGESLTGKSITFSLYSRLKLADAYFSEARVFTAGTRLRSVVRTICELAGMGTDDELYDLSDGGASLRSDRGFDVTDNMLRSAIELAAAFGLELYDDAEGHVVLRPFVDPATVGPAWDFGPGVLTAMTDLEKTLQGRPVYNRVRVKSEAPDSYPRFAEARDTNPLSPTFWTVETDRPAPLKVIKESLDQASLNAVARHGLIEAATTDEVGRGQSYPIPLVAAGDVVTADGKNVLLDTVAMPLRGGNMSFEWRTARSLI